MVDKIDPQSLKLELKSTKTADQREIESLDVGASSLKKKLNMESSNESLYLVGKTGDDKPVAFNAKFASGKIEITGFEFEGQKYSASKPFHVTLTDGKLNPKDISSLEDAINYKSTSVPNEGLVGGFLGTKDTIKFTPKGRVSSLELPEKQGDMKLALAQAAAPATGFKSEHNVTPAAAKPQNSISIG